MPLKKIAAGYYANERGEVRRVWGSTWVLTPKGGRPYFVPSLASARVVLCETKECK